MLKHLIIRASLFATIVAPLWAQSYQTSFTEVNIDRLKAGSQGAPIYQVDHASGALEINIPIGSGIGAGGMHFAPMVVSHVTENISFHVYGFNDSRNYVSTNPVFMSMLPGYLDLKTGPAYDNDFYTFVSRYELWNGINGSLDGFPTRDEGSIDGISLIRSFDYQTEAVAEMKPFGLAGLNGTSVPFKKYTTSGDIFIALYEATSAPLFTLSGYQTPTKVLLIKGDTAYEFTSVYTGDTGQFFIVLTVSG